MDILVWSSTCPVDGCGALAVLDIKHLAIHPDEVVICVVTFCAKCQRSAEIELGISTGEMRLKQIDEMTNGELDRLGELAKNHKYIGR